MTLRLTFNGIVQGIGFRPTAKRIAVEMGINGSVKNSGGNVEIIISADTQALDSYVRRLVDLFEIKNYTKEIIDDAQFSSFEIIHSTKDDALPFITPDLAVCSDCIRELEDKNNRRYRHPFISCINCGPRYSIISSLPYDRENITMAPFEMCENCKTEYTQTADRRCHAQTIACNDCGAKTNISIDEAIDIIKSGEVLAIKDIGGYHLACRSDRCESVNNLRQIKHRDKKPFAVMFNSIEEIRQYCHVNDKEEELLLSSARPIVLLKKKKDFNKNVCGESDYTGAFLPCNPIQVMILSKVSPLVMTSANISGEPIIIDDEEIKKFGVKVLSHDREILTPLDDSVLQVTSNRVQFIRRARGYVPLAIEIDRNSVGDTLCLGGDLKSVFAFHSGKYVFLSQYFGDLEDEKALASYKSNINRFASLHSFKLKRVVADAHPLYYSSNLYKNDLSVQHHKAHIASVIAEHRIKGSVLGFAYDGTGYGDDGAIWGSEVFFFDGKAFERVEHLEYTKMVASDELALNGDIALACYTKSNAIINKAIENNINTVLSSSMGRLFDAVAATLDIKHRNTFEGECAVALENTARRSENPVEIKWCDKPQNILEQIQKAKATHSVQDIAMGFHIMICDMITSIAEKYRKIKNVTQIALSGGVFNNRIITEKTIKSLEEKGFSVYINEKVPCGDGGISLGQAFIAGSEE